MVSGFHPPCGRKDFSGMMRILTEERTSALRRVLNVQLFSMLLIFSPAVDVITGALLLYGHSLSLSALYKGVIFLLCLIRLCCGFPKRWAAWLVVGGILTALSLLIPCIGFDLSVLAYNGNLIVKCYVAFGVMAVYRLFLEENPKRTAYWVRRIFDFYCWFFPLSILLPGLMGVGFPTYAYGVGFKGFYFAGNDISIVMVVAAAISAEAFVQKCTWPNGIRAILAVISLLVLSTKSCLLMAVVIVVIFILRTRNIYLKIGIAAAVAAVGLAAASLFQDEIVSLYESLRYKYRWYLEQGGTVISFLSSGRDEKFMEAFRASYQKDTLRVLLFGTGAWQQLHLPLYHGLIEMDFFDLLIWHGVLLTAYLCTGCFMLYRKVRRHAPFVLKFCWWLIVGFSFMVGHVLFSPMANLVFALVYIAMMCENRSAKARKIKRGCCT